MEAWRAAHPDATAVRRSRVKASARVESATTHAHAATTAVEAATTATHVEAATAATHVDATTAAAMEAATTTAAMEAATTTATVSAATTATTAAATGGRRIGRQGGNHGHARQKCEGKLALHVTPVSKSALSAARVRSAFIRDTCPKLKRWDGRSGFDLRQLILCKVALRHAESRQRWQVAGSFLFAGVADDRAQRQERGRNVAVVHDAAMPRMMIGRIFCPLGAAATARQAPPPHSRAVVE
jgi:hypothetical protein